MREILFKAKRKDNGEWVYGYLQKQYSKSDNGYYITNPHSELLNNCHLVIPETISQYTGLKDKTGVKTFENDIVKIENFDKKYIGAIKFGEFTYSHCDEYNCKHYGWFIDCQNINYCYNTGIDLYAFYKYCEVIGNVFDEEVKQC